MSDAPKLYDVLAVQIKAPNAERIMTKGLTRENAEAYVKTAVLRRGVEEEFYTLRNSQP